jgi:hypothetical protein
LQGLTEDDIFKALDASYIEDISGPTEQKLRPKIETSNAWEDIADDLGMGRDDKDLLIKDSKKEQHKTLIRLLLKKWEDADRSLGSLYRLLIIKGYKQAARILKDGVVDSLQAKGELQKRIGEKAAPMAPQGVIPSQAPYPGQYPIGPQGVPMYEASGYPSYNPDPQQRFYGPQPAPSTRKLTPPPPYASIDDTRSRRTSQPDSSLTLPPSDYKLPEMGSLSISHQTAYQSQGQSIQMAQGMNFPQSGQLHIQESTIEYYGKRPIDGSFSSMPVTGSPQFRRTVDNSYNSMTEVKHAPYRAQESLQQIHASVAMQAQGQSPVLYAGATSGQPRPAQSVGFMQPSTGPLTSTEDASRSQTRGSEVSDRMPCQSDDPSMVTPQLIHYMGAPQQRSMQPSEANYPMMSETQRPAEMTDQTMYRKVLVSANSTETEPPGFSDEAVLRKELLLHQQS